MQYRKKALVAVSSASSAFDKPFSYAVPESLSDKVQRGIRVLVPFGRGNRKRVGFVLDVVPSDGTEDGRLKFILSAEDESPVLSDELTELALWLRETTFCTYFDALKTMLPTGMNINIRERYALTGKEDVSELGSDEMKCLEAFIGSDDASQTAEELKAAGRGLIVESLAAKGFLKYHLDGKQAVGDSTIRMLELTDGYRASPEDYRLTVKQKELVRVIAENGVVSVKEACYLAGVGSTVEKKLLEKGAVREYELEVFRRVETGSTQRRCIDEIRLTDEQQAVYNRAVSVMNENRAHCFLLHGVTGSGKTAVFEKLIDFCLKTDKQALVLIPEISLTPQTVRRFSSLFGELVAVIHSGLSQGQRLDEYKRIKRGLAKIVVGTRSAVFAPLEKIGLIIVDEEGERSYKSDSSPRYSAIDVAKKRCRTHNAVLLLASATPSIESYYYAQKGIYELLEMKQRYSGQSLPNVCIVDMNLERQDGNNTEFSTVLVNEINENLKNHEQTILLLNRRGYHTIISCADCHKPVYCPNCSIPLTYHKPNNTLICHYCGHIQPPVESCPECGSERLVRMGFGTQKLEEQLGTLFPDARILRMDADTTMSRCSYEKGFEAFSKGRYDIMLGTQMIGKGLDFPNVTLVGILSMDKALYAGDFRSYERTFSLTAQVAGRCGRGEKKGRAYLQTFMPDHYVLTLAARQDYRSFYREEIAIRKALLFPPVCDICSFGISGASDEDTAEFAGEFLKIVGELAGKETGVPLRILGPVRCSYGKINNKYRYRIILKCKNNKKFRDLTRKILSEASKLRKYKGISLYADINGDIGI